MYRNLVKPVLLAALLLGMSSFAHATLIPATWSESLTFNQQIPPAYAPCKQNEASTVPKL